MSLQLHPSRSHLRASIANLILRYDFDSGSDNEQEVDVENKYYNAKQMKEDAPEEAIKEFLEVPELEISEKGQKGEWGFKALKQAIKTELKEGKFDEVRVSPPTINKGAN